MEIKSRKIHVLLSPHIVGKTLVLKPNDGKYGLFLEDVLIATCERQNSLEYYAMDSGAQKVIYPAKPDWSYRTDLDD